MNLIVKAEDAYNFYSDSKLIGKLNIGYGPWYNSDIFDASMLCDIQKFRIIKKGFFRQKTTLFDKENRVVGEISTIISWHNRVLRLANNKKYRWKGSFWELRFNTNKGTFEDENGKAVACFIYRFTLSNKGVIAEITLDEHEFKDVSFGVAALGFCILHMLDIQSRRIAI